MSETNTPRLGARGFGVAGALPAEIVMLLASAAESGGYRTFWVNDTPNGDGLAKLQAAARVTSTIRLGVGVIPLDRQPADVIARRVVELELPQDRLSLGIGSGGPRDALRRTGEGAILLQEKLKAEVIIGALGPKMCALAGSHSHGVLLNWLTPAYVEPSAKIVIEAAEQAGRLEPSIYGYVRTALGPAAKAVFLTEAARYASYPAYAANFERMGTPAEDTAVTGDTSAEIQDGLAKYTDRLDETVVRAITGSETGEAYLELLTAAGPAR
jgi:alkanesulfonate monooxygenase SsuD/methylene tetrahydromethanopterin reductase-like flavin-dependent oxidoreductase (luciferase family)